MGGYQIGDKVTLTPSMKRAAVHPELYESGTVVQVGSWNTIDVLWNGLDRPITVRSDEVAPVVKEYVAYRDPDGRVLVDYNGTLWKSGYPAYPKHRCLELERGYTEGGRALIRLAARLREKYYEEA